MGLLWKCLRTNTEKVFNKLSNLDEPDFFNFQKSANASNPDILTNKAHVFNKISRNRRERETFY